MRQTEVATMSDTPRLDAARAALAAAEALLATVRDALAQRATERGKISNECIDRMQQPVYEFALAATGLRVAGSMLEYAANATELETRLAVLCTAEALHDLRNRLERSPADFGLDAAAVAQAFATRPCSPVSRSCVPSATRNSPRRWNTAASASSASARITK
jgi:hypothetical protein